MGLPDPKVLHAPTSGVAIRPAVPGDAGGWIALLEEVAAEGHFIALEQVGTTKRQLARYFRTNAWTHDAAAIAAISADHKVVGQLTVLRDRAIYRHIAELGMSVTSSYRRKGIGTEMMSGAFDWARSFGVEKLCLNVFPHNTRAIALYEKMGFSQEGHRSRHAKLSYGYEDLIEMAAWV